MDPIFYIVSSHLPWENWVACHPNSKVNRRQPKKVIVRLARVIVRLARNEKNMKIGLLENGNVDPKFMGPAENHIFQLFMETPTDGI